MKFYRKLIWILSVGLVGFLGLAATKPSQPWLSCYEKKTNTMHFQALGKRLKNGDTCLGSTKYKASLLFKLIQNVSVDEEGFAESRPGTKRTMVLKNGRRLLVSQWSGLGKSNRILVLEPNLKTHSVVRHCNIENFSDAFSARYSEKTGKMMIQITSPTNKKHTRFSRVWRSCEI